VAFIYGSTLSYRTVVPLTRVYVQFMSIQQYMRTDKV